MVLGFRQSGAKATGGYKGDEVHAAWHTGTSLIAASGAQCGGRDWRIERILCPGPAPGTLRCAMDLWNAVLGNLHDTSSTAVSVEIPYFFFEDQRYVSVLPTAAVGQFFDVPVEDSKLHDSEPLLLKRVPLEAQSQGSAHVGRLAAATSLCRVQDCGGGRQKITPTPMTQIHMSEFPAKLADRIARATD